jgi:cobyrinic acid a,c-diamide synthase
LLAIADRSPLPTLPADDLLFDLTGDSLRIALAYDEEFCGYFPDTLDLLEAAGAELCDFSPLRSGSLPDGADVVYFGCGHPERQPEVLARNHCLQQSLRQFAAAGGRIYGEGSGLAYLCREIDLGDGRRVPMTGLLPAVARRIEPAGRPDPVEITFTAGCWLVEEGDYLRGYRHPGWSIEPLGSMISFAQAPNQRLDMLGRANVVGSRLLVNLAANEHLLRRFIAPTAPVGAIARGKF